MLVTFENGIFHISAKESLHLYILGPRSAGKSTLSEHISKKLGIKCYDMDSELEKKLRVDGGGLSDAIKLKAWQKISMALQESLCDLLALDFPYVASIPTGIFAYEQSALLLESVVILGILPGKTEEEALALLIERERERIHFRERVKENSQDELLQEVVREYRHGLSKAITLTQIQSDACYFYGNETPDAIVRKCFGIP